MRRLIAPFLALFVLLCTGIGALAQPTLPGWHHWDHESTTNTTTTGYAGWFFDLMGGTYPNQHDLYGIWEQPSGGTSWELNAYFDAVFSWSSSATPQSARPDVIQIKAERYLIWYDNNGVEFTRQYQREIPIVIEDTSHGVINNNPTINNGTVDLPGATIELDEVEGLVWPGEEGVESQRQVVFSGKVHNAYLFWEAEKPTTYTANGVTYFSGYPTYLRAYRPALKITITVPHPGTTNKLINQVRWHGLWLGQALPQIIEGGEG